jgi:type IV pilus assembly protein PilY1
MDTMALFRQRFIQAAVVAAALCAPAAQAAPTLSIPPDPLATPSTSIQPNVMLILDDSGSMGGDILPDYITDNNDTASISGSHPRPNSTAACADAGDDDDLIQMNYTFSGSNNKLPDPCVFGDPPYNSPDFNGVYYNPEIYYRPAANADGTDKTSMTAANTSSWTKVPTDVYLSAATTNIVTGYLDRVWCTSQSDTATSGNCRQNSAYQFPNFVFKYGRTTGGSVKTVTGAPYYYRMQSAQYCQPPAMTNCASGSSINPSIHTQLAPEFCSDIQLRNCAAGATVTNNPTAWPFFGVRWCSDSATLTTCQKAKIFDTKTNRNYLFAKHLGVTTSINCTATPSLCDAVQNEGNIQVSTVNAAGGTLTITINGVQVTSAPISFGANSTTSALAGQITTAINGFVSAPDYTASQSGANVNVTMVQPGAAGNGNAVSVTASTIGTVASIGAITVGTSSSSLTLTALSVNGTNLLCTSATALNFNNGVTVAAGSASIAATGLSTTAQRDSMRAALISRINTCAQTITGGYTVTAVDASPNVKLVAPVAMGSTPNGQTVAKAGSGTGLSAITTINMGGSSPGQVGVSVATATFVVTNMSGGRDLQTGTIDRRIGLGAFSRTDIVPSNNSYTRASARIDCAGATCTYAEEMTNFANWYAYYRKRLLMAKTAVGRAFAPLNDTYRVGLITICPISGSCDSTSTTDGKAVVAAKYLKVDTFDATHKSDWYTKLYSIQTAGFTPLREALSRVGQLFAGQLGSHLTTGLTAVDDPMTASCQPNFAILATDGYWNGFTGQKLDGSAMDNEDGNASGTDKWTSVATGTFEGTGATSTGSLADVAMYYYKNDLRTSGPLSTDNVRTTTKDKASFQHMVTFTIGLGLDGQLTYQRDYETAKTGDFFNITQGTDVWPVPAADQPSALDDLWHAAVNGRGLFFSARNPSELAASLQDTLNELRGDTGAGAAAATSNLQPVSGDNFAFVASYHSGDWWGELSARTIDLTTLDVSVPEAQLWSAKDKLDATKWDSRVIYTFDPGDTAGNKLKNFCWPGTGTAVCADGSGLTSAEQAWFTATKLSQTSNWGAAGSPQWTNATGKSLVDYVRGDASNEDTGLGGTQDLYRPRVSKLGDLVNAQPAYVRKSTFNFSDKGYAGFKACTAGTGTGCNVAQFPNASIPRRGTVYAAGNDGMLHAFETDVNNSPYYQTEGIASPALTDDKYSGGNNTGNGVERWSYIPRMLMENLTLLADSANIHHFFADGSPRAFDICISNPCAGQDDWRTILVAGVNAGGSIGTGPGSLGYYALDITNPLAPKGMWEFTNNGVCYTDTDIAKQDKTSDCNLGLTYGMPVVAKRTNGRWVVLVTSGYNNTFRGGDGRGYLYILDAVTGVILDRITTGSGSAASPSGLAKIAAWADDISTDATALAVYGGDLDGNLWRFKLDASPVTVTLVAALKDSSGNAQPVTTTPELTLVQGKRVILVGTGKFIENTDKTPPFKTQTIYALADDDAVTGPGPVIKNVRDPADIAVETFAPGADVDERTIKGTPPDWKTQHGWLADLPDPGERVNIDPIVQLGVLSMPSNVPTSDTCSAGGYGWFNFLDVETGSYVPAPGNTMASKRVSDALLVGQSFVCGPGGNCGVIAIDNKGRPRVEPPPLSPQGFSGKRVSWRELIGDQ